MNYDINLHTKKLKIIEENHYYPFGMKNSSYNSSLKGFKEVGTNGITELGAARVKANLALRQIARVGLLDHKLSTMKLLFYYKTDAF